MIKLQILTRLDTLECVWRLIFQFHLRENFVLVRMVINSSLIYYINSSPLFVIGAGWLVTVTPTVTDFLHLLCHHKWILSLARVHRLVCKSLDFSGAWMQLCILVMRPTQIQQLLCQILTLDHRWWLLGVGAVATTVNAVDMVLPWDFSHVSSTCHNTFYPLMITLPINPTWLHFTLFEEVAVLGGGVVAVFHTSL